MSLVSTVQIWIRAHPLGGSLILLNNLKWWGKHQFFQPSLTKHSNMKFLSHASIKSFTVHPSHLLDSSKCQKLLLPPKHTFFSIFAYLWSHTLFFFFFFKSAVAGIIVFLVLLCPDSAFEPCHCCKIAIKLVLYQSIFLHETRKKAKYLLTFH